MHECLWIFPTAFSDFPRKNISDQLMKGAPPGSIGVAHSSGWVQTNILTRWFKVFFFEKGNPTKDSPALFILDGHYSHVCNFEIYELARSNHVTILTTTQHFPTTTTQHFPTNTSQHFQTTTTQHFQTTTA